ncbi:MAG TPA: hypothetical protein VHE35_07565 [Kofleriaceae bacterium]|nr:hypothetical protein [Kofleriaceae bacterium]
MPIPAAPPAPELAGCDRGWWPIAAGQRYRWRVERTWYDGDTRTIRTVRADRESVVTATPGRGAAARYTITGWPEPWTDELAATTIVEVDGTHWSQGDPTDARLSPWFELGRDAPAQPGALLDREVTPAAAGKPAVLSLVWPAMVDDLTLQLACGVGPVALDYHHHGTREDLHAVRLPDKSAAGGP